MVLNKFKERILLTLKSLSDVRERLVIHFQKRLLVTNSEANAILLNINDESAAEETYEHLYKREKFTDFIAFVWHYSGWARELTQALHMEYISLKIRKGW